MYTKQHINCLDDLYNCPINLLCGSHSTYHPTHQPIYQNLGALPTSGKSPTPTPISAPAFRSHMSCMHWLPTACPTRLQGVGYLLGYVGYLLLHTGSQGQPRRTWHKTNPTRHVPTVETQDKQRTLPSTTFRASHFVTVSLVSVHALAHISA